MKHLIKIEPTAHGVLGMRHAGRDQQYCEAGELVIIEWQPDAGWGLQEAHYTDKDGNVTAIGGGSFTMPDKEITIGGTFKRFVLEDWTGDVTAENITAEGNVAVKGDVKVGGDVKVKGDVTAENVTAENVTARKFLVLKDVDSSEWCKVFVEHGQLIVIPL